jgi:hypothetical protein
MQRMVVLANSRKHGGYCLAGKVLNDAGEVGGWLRPVLASAGNGLPHRRTVCSDGKQATILDVVSQSWGVPRPALHQRENRLMGPEPLRRCGRVAWDDLPALADDAHTGLWIDGYSSGCGFNDRVSVDRLVQLPGSLMLISVRDLVLSQVFGYENHPKYRASFCIGKRHYNLALTDTVATLWLTNTPRLELADAYVCVSLAVPFQDGFAYKLATAVITRARAENAI